MFNKKAVSDVVSTVLIILLVVAAVAIVGAIILRVVGNAGPQVDTAVQCQTLEVTANSCVLTGGVVTTATATRGAGGSELVLESITYQFQTSAGVAISPTAQNIVAIDLATKFSPISATLAGLTISAPAKMVVFGKIKGATNACSASQPVNCA